MNKSIVGRRAVFITILIWGTTLISTEVLLWVFSPIEILLIRFLIGYLVLWLAFFHRLQVKEKWQKLYFVATGLCGATLYYLFENITLTYTPASNAGMIVPAAPFFTVICSCLLLHGKRPGKRSFVRLLIAIAGIGLISFGSDASSQLNPLGDILALMVAVIWAVYSTITKKISEFGYGTIQTTQRKFLYGPLFMIPMLFAMNLQVNPKMFYDRIMVLNLLPLGLGISAICSVTWDFTVKVLGAVKTTIYICMAPMTTTVTSVLTLYKWVSWPMVRGVVLALMGLFLSENRKQEGVAAEDGVDGSGSTEVPEVPGI